MASAGLGGLGEREGAPVFYDWVPSSPLPPLIPWLAVLVLLAMASNRTLKAWWIWAPLLVVTAGESLFSPLFDFIPSSACAVLRLAFNSLAFGIAAIWLLAAHLNHRLRFIVFLKMVCIAAGMSGLAYLARTDWDAPEESIGFMVPLGISVLITVTALSLAGLVCRRRYRPIVLFSSLALLCTALWLLIILPLFLIAMATGSGGNWIDLAQAVLMLVASTYAVLLPFLVLAMANALYRQRLITLFRLSDPAAASPPQPPTVTDALERATAAAPEI